MLTDRTELLEQAEGHAGDLLTAAMVETTYNRMKRGYQPADEFDFVIIDEVHVGSFRKVLHKLPDSLPALGVTATPIYSNGVGLLGSGDYSAMVCGPQISELLKQGYLAQPTTLVPNVALAGLKQRAGEYTPASQVDAFREAKLMDGAIDMWEAHCRKQGRWLKTIFYNINIEHNEEVTKELQRRGHTVYSVTGKTPKEERKAAFEGFAGKSGNECGTADDRLSVRHNQGDEVVSFQKDVAAGHGKAVAGAPVLCNVAVATKGYDCPDVECIVINHATRSLTRYLQECGRGARNATPTFTIIDMARNCVELGPWQMNRDWHELANRTSRPKKGDPPAKICDSCLAVNYQAARICVSCQTPFPLPTPKEVLVATELVPLDMDVSSMTPQQLAYQASALNKTPAWAARWASDKSIAGLTELGRALPTIKKPAAWAYQTRRWLEQKRLV